MNAGRYGLDKVFEDIIVNDLTRLAKVDGHETGIVPIFFVAILIRHPATVAGKTHHEHIARLGVGDHLLQSHLNVPFRRL